jgi:hypothetical protein
MTLRGSSLSPLAPDGSTVTFEWVSFNRVRVGDLIVYRAPDCLICHQVVRRTDSELTTRGFWLPGLDPPVTADRLLGRVTELGLPGARLLRLDTRRFAVGSWLLARCGLWVAIAHEGCRGLGWPWTGRVAPGGAGPARWLTLGLRTAARVLRAVSRRAEHSP